MKIKYYFLITFLICIIAYPFFAKTLQTKPINQIDPYERLELELIFRTLIYENHFGYTLFGDKPVSIGGYFIREPVYDFAIWESKPGISLHRLWPTWKKYEHKLKIKNYLMLNEANPRSENNRTITLINKRAFLTTVRNHLQDFQAVLGSHITPEKLLEQLELPNASLYETLHRNEFLYGILLGFGRENAAFYLKRLRFYEILDIPIPITENPYESYSLAYPVKNASFEDLRKEYDSLKKDVVFFGWDSKLCPMQPPRFIAIKDDLETLALEKKYRDIQHKLLKIYGEGDFLEITLEQLCR